MCEDVLREYSLAMIEPKQEDDTPRRVDGARGKSYAPGPPSGYAPCEGCPGPDCDQDCPASPPTDGETHELKVWPEYYSALIDGSKTFEHRFDDRGFKVGDVLDLRCYNPDSGHYSGRRSRWRVTYILRGPAWGVREGYVVMSVARDGGDSRTPKPCPRPGCKSRWHISESLGMCRVYCDVCGLAIGWQQSKEEAIALWNRLEFAPHGGLSAGRRMGHGCAGREGQHE